MASQMQLSRSLVDRVAIVTGAGSGMGRATAALLVAEGASVVGVDRDAAGLDSLSAELGSEAPLHVVPVDLTDSAAPATVLASTHEAFGPVDILINAAGISIPVELSDESFLDTWRLTFAVNVDAQVLLIAACLDDARRRTRTNRRNRELCVSRTREHGHDRCY
jgi:NADP-dependent 3-hydroxy acid dehydrogenase YdfG